MTLHELANLAHRFTHRHTLLSKEGVGEFKTCGWRLPWARVRAGFKPDFSEAGWYYVPAVEDENGDLLVVQMSRTENAWHAMSVLRAEYAAMENR